MRIFIIIIFFVSTNIFSQNNHEVNNLKVTGLITQSDGAYLVLEQGFVKIYNPNIYIEYYKQIYNDSSLVNPNTELKEDFEFNIIPFIYPYRSKNRIKFSAPLNLGVFFTTGHKNNLQISKKGREIIDSLMNK